VIEIFTDSGRLVRPVFYVDKGKTLALHVNKKMDGIIKKRELPGIL